MYGKYFIFSNILKDTFALIAPSQKSSSSFQMYLSHHPCHFLKQFWYSSFLSVFRWCFQYCYQGPCIESTPIKTLLYIFQPFIHQIMPVLWDSWLFLIIKMTMQNKHFEWTIEDNWDNHYSAIQDLSRGLKRTYRTALPYFSITPHELDPPRWWKVGNSI